MLDSELRDLELNKTRKVNFPYLPQEIEKVH